MKYSDKTDRQERLEDLTGLTEEDMNEFISAVSYEEQWRLLLAHAEKNRKIIKIRRLKEMNNEQYNDHSYEEISRQFEEFCHTKGIVAKFKVAFGNMEENARKQKEVDKAQLEEVKRQSAEANPEFAEFLHTKGFKAKVKLVIANIKKGCQEAPHKTAVAVDGISAQTKANIARAQAGVYRTTAGYGTQSCGVKMTDASEYSIDELSREFNEFLKEKGLDGKYAVEVTDDDKE